MDFSRILYSTGDRRATVTLNRPETHNVLDDVAVAELTSAITMAGRDPAVKVILLQSKGSTFCAGMDPEYLARITQLDLEVNRQDSLRLAAALRAIHDLRKPVIAAVQGPALGVGAGLASVADFVIAARDAATFGFPEVRIGVIPAILLVFLVKRVGEGKARELVIRGSAIAADEAQRIGLASMVVAASKVQSAAQALAEELVTMNSANAMGLCKEMLSKLHGMNLPDALDFAANLNAAARMTVESRSGIGAFVNKQTREW